MFKLVDEKTVDDITATSQLMNEGMLCSFKPSSCLINISFEEWATTEGNLHRCLASKLLASHGRTSNARWAVAIRAQHVL